MIDSRLTPADAADMLIVEAVAFCRGIEGRILPAPDLFGSDHAVALLKLAGKLEDAAR